MSTRDRAAALSADIAGRLADPDRVRALLPARGDPSRTLTLSDGAPGIALLHLERGRAAEGALGAAHRWLAHAVAHANDASGATPPSAPGLYLGIPALSFAMCRAELVSGRPVRAAARLAGHVRAFARGLAAWERRRRPHGGECVSVGTYDVISGLAGLGAHLLDGRQDGVEGSGETLAEVLTALTGLAVPLRLDGRSLPGWWTAQHSSGYAPTAPETGHANVGLAHGAPGPLALLALAWRHHVVVPGQERAIRVLAEWLMDIERRDEEGSWWPRTLVLAPGGAVTANESAPGRASWCYGTVGIARALYLAGSALDVPEWRRAALAGWHAALSRARHAQGGPAGTGLTDAGLCHGWAGVLQATWRMADDTGDARLRAWLPWLADRVLELAAPDRPFGLRPPLPDAGTVSDPAGFLTGAAGAALALHTFATDTAPVTRWDRALLLA